MHDIQESKLFKYFKHKKDEHPARVPLADVPNLPDPQQETHTYGQQNDTSEALEQDHCALHDFGPRLVVGDLGPGQDGRVTAATSQRPVKKARKHIIIKYLVKKL